MRTAIKKHIPINASSEEIAGYLFEIMEERKQNIGKPEFDSAMHFMYGRLLFSEDKFDKAYNEFRQSSTLCIDNGLQEDYQLYDSVHIPVTNGLRIFLNKSDASGLKFKRLSDYESDTGGWWPGYYPDTTGIRKRGRMGFYNQDISGIEDIDGDGDIDIIGLDGSQYIVRFWENWTINPQHIQYNHDSLIYIYRDECWGFAQFDIYAGKNSFKLRQTMGDSMSSCIWQMYPRKTKHSGSTELMIDLNDDGIKDLVYGDLSYTNLISLINDRKHNSLGRDSLINQDTIFPRNTTPANFILQPAAFYIDINNDGIKELLVTSSNSSSVKSANNVWVYSNTGKNSLPVFNYEGNNFFVNQESIDLGTRSVPVLVDIDKDGDKDLIVATNGDYAQTQNYNDRLVFYKNITNDSTKPAIFVLADTNFLMLSKDTPIINLHPTFGDLNGDGKEDLIIGCQDGSLMYYINQSVGTNFSFSLQSRHFSNVMVRGYAAPQLVDFNKDGKLDLVIGNKQGDIQYFQNTGTKTVPQFSSVPTIDTLGGVFVNKVEMQDGYPNTSPTGYATPIVCDLNNDGNFEMLVGSEPGYLYLFTGVNATPGTKFSKYVLQSINGVYQFVDEPSSFKSNLLNFGYRIAPFAGNLDGDSKTDIILGSMRGGLNIFCSLNFDHVGINEVSDEIKGKINLYPNPADQSITISTENIDDDLNYVVFNDIGKSMDKGIISKYYSEKQINIESYTPGIYFILFKNSNGYSESKRFLITR